MWWWYGAVKKDQNHDDVLTGLYIMKNYLTSYVWAKALASHTRSGYCYY